MNKTIFVIITIMFLVSCSSTRKKYSSRDEYFKELETIRYRPASVENVEKSPTFGELLQVFSDSARIMGAKTRKELYRAIDDADMNQRLRDGEINQYEYDRHKEHQRELDIQEERNEILREHLNHRIFNEPLGSVPCLPLWCK